MPVGKIPEVGQVPSSEGTIGATAPAAVTKDSLANQAYDINGDAYARLPPQPTPGFPELRPLFYDDKMQTLEGMISKLATLKSQITAYSNNPNFPKTNEAAKTVTEIQGKIDEISTLTNKELLDLKAKDKNAYDADEYRRVHPNPSPFPQPSQPNDPFYNPAESDSIFSKCYDLKLAIDGLPNLV